MDINTHVLDCIKDYIKEYKDIVSYVIALLGAFIAIALNYKKLIELIYDIKFIKIKFLHRLKDENLNEDELDENIKYIINKKINENIFYQVTGIYNTSAKMQEKLKKLLEKYPSYSSNYLLSILPYINIEINNNKLNISSNIKKLEKFMYKALKCIGFVLLVIGIFLLFYAVFLNFKLSTFITSLPFLILGFFYLYLIQGIEKATYFIETEINNKAQNDNQRKIK
ncbi:hypothetical protein C3L23_06210 [Nautilia sp. PV-1]|uniref:hypothetical protein n=1 Tax=Nautilia sp. PV-1 TaxID=2579250 RepID=UPI000FDBC4CD|nr:hypothetical protein [Nautilia sp. PV-1]AZV46880.1 hypothetical protein C3L23_06210 [Nautilia sp. PV-1]